MPPNLYLPNLRRMGHRLTFLRRIGCAAVVITTVIPACGPDPERLRGDARIAAQAGRWDEAERLLDQLTEPTPTDRILRAQVARARNDTGSVRSSLEGMAAEGTLGAQREYLLGQLALDEHHARDAEAAFRRALELDPSLAEARRGLIYILGIQFRRREFHDQFARLADQATLSPAQVQDWCISHETIGDPARVIPDLQRFADGDPHDVQSRLALATAAVQLGDHERAEELLTHLDPTDPDVLERLVELATARGDVDEAQRLLANGPEDHPGLARQRGLLALSRRDFQTALKDLKLADRADPNRRDVLLGLSQALRATGDPETADRYAERARAQATLRALLIRRVDRPPTTADDFCELGEASEAAGWVDESLAWYRLAIAASPLNSQAQIAIHRLRERLREPSN